MNRRKFLVNGLRGSASLRLLSAVSGLPISFLLSGSTQAQSSANLKYLICSMSGGGEPLNVYGPGCFPKNADDPANQIEHPSSNMNNIEGAVNGRTLSVADLAVPGERLYGRDDALAARAFEALPEDMLQHMCYFNYDSQRSGHGDIRSVSMANGALKDTGGVPNELASVYARAAGPELGTMMSSAISLGSFAVSDRGVPALNLKTDALFELFNVEAGAIDEDLFASIYNAYTKKFYRDYKNLNVAQKNFVDNHLHSVSESRDIGNDIGALLKCPDQYTDDNECLPGSDLKPVGESINNKEQATYDQLRAALVLFYLNVTPCAVVKHKFGGDNHADPSLERETSETIGTLSALSDFYRLLNEHSRFSGLKDKICYATLDVFGRTIRLNDKSGRDHYSRSTYGLIYGNHINELVVGGLGDRRAVTTFNSSTGLRDINGDVLREDSLSCYIKTILASCGLPAETYNQMVPGVNAVTTML